MKLSVSHLFFIVFLFTYLYIYFVLQTLCTILIQSIDPSLLMPYFLASQVAFPFPCLALPVSLPCVFP